jgi:hypothetical protein
MNAREIRRLRSTIVATAASAALLFSVERSTAQTPPPKVVARTEGVEMTASIRPPLSIHDSLRSIDLIASRLKNVERPPVGDEADRLDLWLQMIQRYLRRVDNAATDLALYQWHHIRRERVERGQTQIEIFEPLEPIARVNAVGIRVTRGDIWIEKLAAHGKDGSVWEFDLKRAVAADLPQPTVCFVDVEIELVKVIVTCRQMTREEDKNPRLYIDAGISSVPEKGKETIDHLNWARKHLTKAEWAQSENRLRGAIASLTAYQRLRERRN